MDKGRFISLEGLSGVGKSTVSKLLAQELGAELVGTIPDEFNDLRKVMDHFDSKAINARFCLFLAAVFYSERSITELLNQGKDVVVESWLYRTIAFHRGMGSRLGVELPQGLLIPQPTFHLVCEEEERQRRRRRRIKMETYWDRLAEERAELILCEYNRFPMECIETTHHPPESVATLILERISQGGK